MKLRSCLVNLLLVGVVLVLFGSSSWFWFKFFVRGESIQTPELQGKSIAEARAITSDLGLVMVVDNLHDRNSPGVPPGHVVWQNRRPGSTIKRGTRLYVGQSLGPLVLKVPDLEGQSVRTALLRFSQRNLRLGNVAYVESEGREGIIASDPAKGTTVGSQTPVSLLVGTAAKPVRFVMPDLIDRPADRVRNMLEAYGLSIGTVRYEQYPGLPDGIVIRQYPLSGSPVSSKDAIALVVSRAEGGADPRETMRAPEPQRPQ